MSRPPEAQPPSFGPQIGEQLPLGRPEPREHVEGSATPIWDRLSVIPNERRFGLTTTTALVDGVRNAASQGRKSVVAFIGPSGAGKTTNITEFLVKLGIENPDIPAHQKPKAAIIPSERIYDVGKKLGLIPKLQLHGQYSHEAYDIGAKMMVQMTNVSLAEGNNLVLIDTPSTTGAILDLPYGDKEQEKRQFGKNRGTSTIRELGKQSGKDFDLFVVAVVPGLHKIQRTFEARRVLELLKDPEQIRHAFESMGRERDDPDVPIPGASSQGLRTINDEIDDMLLSLYFNGVLGLEHTLDISPTSADFPTNLWKLTKVRRELLGKFYPLLLQDDLGITTNNALIVQNEDLELPPGKKLKDRSGLYDRFNYVLAG